MTIWFTSDLHLGHRKVSGLRGFWTYDQDDEKVPDTAAHDQTLAKNWDMVVHPEDTVWILGDLSLNSGPQVAEWLSQRPGQKNLVSGNHDKSNTAIFPKYYKKKIEEWSPLFGSIQDEATIEIAGRAVTLSHLPFWHDGDGERAKAEGYVSRYEKLRPWEGPDTILLYGHIHDNVQATGRSYHVGLDGHGLQLVPLSVIEAWVNTLD